MTREEILAMQPGTDLNVEVAEKIMGHITNKDKIANSRIFCFIIITLSIDRFM